MPSEATSTSQGLTAPSISWTGWFDLSQFPITRRIGKITFAIALCSAGAFGMISNSTYISSSDAVVSADVVEVRAPIEGTMTGLPLTEGAFVHAGQLLGVLNNPRSDRQHLDNLLAAESNSESMVEALTAERSELQVQKKELLSRSNLDNSAVASRLNQQAESAGRTLVGLEQARDEASIELFRGERLHEAGIIADAALDKLRSDQRIAAAEVEAQKLLLASIHSEGSDAARGILAEPGDASDVAYSRQRSDEIAIKLADNETALAVARGESKQARVDTDTETLRESLMRRSDVRSPIDGTLWRLNVADNENISNGTPVLSLVNCSRQFVLAQIPQDRVPDVALHREARVRLSGESEERVGVVESVSGDVLKLQNTRLAALPLQESTQQMATVVIGLKGGRAPGAVQRSGSGRSPQGGDECLVGRTARVLVPTYSSSSFVSRWMHETF